MSGSSLVNKFIGFIKKDTSNENETAQFLIMLRYLCLVFFVYFFVFTAIIGVADPKDLSVIGLLWPVALVLMFLATYKFGRRVCFHIYSTGFLTWMFIMVAIFGWDVGLQLFLMPLIVTSFFATYENLSGKIIYMVFLFAFRLGMFIFYQRQGMIAVLDVETELYLQVASTIFVFAEMFVTCYIFSTTNQDATEKLAFYNEKLKRESETDTLTGLMNRRCMYSIIEKSMNRSDMVFTVAMCDIDFFKKVNDTLGHECGDEVLKQIAAYFIKYMEDKGSVCRWGGEEFVFVFNDKNGDDAFMMAEHIRKHVEDMTISYGDIEVKVTVTFGVEEYNQRQSFSELIKKADDKLYMGKEKGRNCVIY